MASSVAKLRPLPSPQAPARLRLLGAEAPPHMWPNPEDPDPQRPDEVEDEFARREAEAAEDRALCERFLEAGRSGSATEVEASFRMLVVRHQDRVQRLVHRYVKDALETEDVTQEVFLKVYRKLDTFQWDSAFTTWLYRVTVNTASDWVAKRRRRPMHLSEDVSVLAGSDGGWSAGDERPGGLPKATEAPDERMLGEERARVTRELLEELPENYRRVLFLREFEELSYLEIAEVLECSLGTVESRLFRARARFRKLLDEKHPELLG